jgi:hypothetical protein
MCEATFRSRIFCSPDLIDHAALMSVYPLFSGPSVEAACDPSLYPDTIMKTTIYLTCIGFSFTAMSNVSSAAVLLSDNFDSYANQAAFETAWAPIGTTVPISATLAADQASSPSQSIKVDGTLTSNQQRNQRSFAESGAVTTTTMIVFSFDFYDSNATVAPYRQYSYMQDGTSATGTGQIVGMGMNNNQLFGDSGGNYYMARILGYTPTLVDPDGGPNEGTTLSAGMFFKLNDFVTSPLRSTGWHNLMVKISTDDGLSADFAFYVDGILAERVSNVGTAATLRSYDLVRIGSGVSNANNAAWYDNFSVEVVIPEPSTIGLGLMGMLAFACRRRRH